jgi:hypothetical protein
MEDPLNWSNIATLSFAGATAFSAVVTVRLQIKEARKREEMAKIQAIFEQCKRRQRRKEVEEIVARDREICAINENELRQQKTERIKRVQEKREALKGKAFISKMTNAHQYHSGHDAVRGNIGNEAAKWIRDIRSDYEFRMKTLACMYDTKESKLRAAIFHEYPISTLDSPIQPLKLSERLADADAKFRSLILEEHAEAFRS